jgi:dihydrolipoamide dehydrogenase
VPHIFAMGDVVGQPMLAHKATHEGKVAAEVTAGQNSYFDATVIPSVAYTDFLFNEVAPTENEAKAAGIKYGKASFPWAASGRSLSLGRDEGQTKYLVRQATHRLLATASSAPVPAAHGRPGIASDGADRIGLTIRPARPSDRSAWRPRCAPSPT